MQEESIYNLIPKEILTPPKQKLYRSRFYHSIPPTGSTFVHHTTSVPKVSNLGGGHDEFIGGHAYKSAGASFGKPRGQVKPDTKNYTKKGTGKMGSSYLPAINSAFRYSDDNRKAALPKRDEKPIMGLKTSKNYVLANKVENMLAQPRVIEEPVDWVKKKEYGAVPRYLERIKEQTQREYEHLRALQQQEQEQQDSEKFVLSEEELQELREGLKAKWFEVNKKYQLLTHKATLDTIGQRRRKEDCEKELNQLEKDLEKLNRGNVIVDARGY